MESRVNKFVDCNHRKNKSTGLYLTASSPVPGILAVSYAAEQCDLSSDDAESVHDPRHLGPLQGLSIPEQ